MNLKPGTRLAAPAILGAAFVLRAAYCLHSGNALIYPDEQVYHGLALQLLGGADWGQLFQYREPLYPVLVWLVYKVTGPLPLAVKLLQAALSCGAAWLLYRSALRLFGRRAALFALALAAFYPFTVFYDARLLRESLLVLLGTASVCAALAPGGLTGRRLAAASLLAGIAALAKTVFLFYWLALMAAALLLRRASLKWALLSAALFAAAVSPLAVSNYRASGSLFLTRGQMFNLYAALAEPMDAHGAPDENARLMAIPEYRAGMALPEGDRDAYFSALVRREVKERPLNFARITAWRFAKLWRLYPYRGVEYSAGAWALLAAVSLMSDGWLIPLALWAAWRLRARAAELMPAYVYAASLTLIYSLSWSQMRYRLPIMPFFILLAAYALPGLLARAGLIGEENA